MTSQAVAVQKKVGSTAERPVLGADVVFTYFDTDFGAWFRWTGSAWRPVRADATADDSLFKLHDAAAEADTSARSAALALATFLAAVGNDPAFVPKLLAAVALKAPLDSPILSAPSATATPDAGDSSLRLATTAFVARALAALVDSSPAALDTLKELADALGDDAHFSTTVLNALAGKAPLSYPVFSNRVSGISTVGQYTQNFKALAPGGSPKQTVGYSFYPTFDYAGDTGPRRAADIVAGFNGGAWISEYLAFCVGSTPVGNAAGTGNDAEYPTLERMRLTGAGRLGIGTSAPAYPLDVNGSARALELIVDNNNNVESRVIFDNRSTSGRSFWLISGGAAGSFGGGKFGLWDSNAGAVRWIVDATGKFGIGKNNPAKTLDVAGDANFDGSVTVGQVAQLAPGYNLGASITHPAGSVTRLYDDGNGHIESNKALWINSTSNAALSINAGGGDVNLGGFLVANKGVYAGASANSTFGNNWNAPGDLSAGGAAASGANSARIAMRYDQANDMGRIGAVQPGVAWKPITYQGAYHQFVSMQSGAVSLNLNGDGSAAFPGSVTFSKSINTASFTVATLPVGVAGAMTFASNGCKAGEASGAGTGVLVVYSNNSWRRLSDDSAVTA